MLDCLTAEKMALETQRYPTFIFIYRLYMKKTNNNKTGWHSVHAKVLHKCIDVRTNCHTALLTRCYGSSLNRDHF